jgi:outer membrane protein assembly factor BamB
VYANGYEDLFAFDATSGASLWETKIVDSNLCCSPLIWQEDGQICIVYRNDVFALDKETHQEIWRYTTGDFSAVSHVELGDGVVYCEIGSTSSEGGDGNHVVALVPATPTLKAGGAARVTTLTSLRGGPSPTGVVRAELAPGTVVTITGESKSAGNVVWWPVTVEETGDQGWVEASTLEPLTSGSDA